MRVMVAAWCFAGLVACGTTEGPLLHAIDAIDSGVVEDAAAPAIAITQDMAWQYQLTGAVDTQSDATLFVIDLFESAEVVAELHARDAVVVAYLSAGTFEPFRSDADEFPEEAIGNSHANYPEESWLDIRDPQVRALMLARIERARASGFDGILPTSLAGYVSDTGFDLTAQDQLEYGEWLATQAAQRGLLIGMAGDFQLVEQLLPRFDWAMHYGCIARGDCAPLEAFKAAGKPVFDLETEGDLAEICAQGAAIGVNVMLKRPQLDAFRMRCP